MRIGFKLVLMLSLFAMSFLQAQEDFYTLPFVSNFDTLDNRWSVTNKNADDYTWTIVAKIDAETTPTAISYIEGLEQDTNFSQAAIFNFMAQTQVNDYIYTKKGIQMSQGKVSISFWYVGKGGSQAGFDEKLRLVWSKDGKDWQQLGDTIVLNKAGWRKHIHELDVQEAGSYYIGFHACSKIGFQISIDELVIKEGEAEKLPGVEIKEVFKPLASCSLDWSKFGVKIENVGQVDIKKLTLKCTPKGSTQDRVIEETLENLNIAVNDTATLLFTSYPEPSTAGVYSYDISVEYQMEDAKEREVLASTSVDIVLTEIIEPPFVSDFANEQDRLNWDGDSNYWDYDKGILHSKFNTQERTELASGVIEPWQVMSPLYSSCVSLQANVEYSIIMTYECEIFFTMKFEDDIIMKIGKNGEDTSTWVNVFEIIGAGTNGVTEEYQNFKVQEAGEYVLGIFPKSYGDIYIHKIELIKTPDYDLAIKSANTSLAYETPFNQANKFTLGAIISNRGKKEAAGKLEVKYNDKKIGEASFVAIESTKNRILELECEIEGKIGIGTQDLDLTLSIEESLQDEVLSNNEMKVNFITNETTFKMDDLGEDTNRLFGAGAYSSKESSLIMGSIFTVVESDTLTQIIVGFDSIAKHLEEDDNIRNDIKQRFKNGYNIGLFLYSMDEAISLYDSEVKREPNGGLITYEIAPRVLKPGKYYIGVANAYEYDPRAASDGVATDSVYIYDRVQDKVYGLMVYGGNLIIRPVFGSSQEVFAKDLELETIVRPKVEGDFSSQEIVVVRIKNNGYENSETFEVHLKVDDGEKQVQKLALDAYQSADLEFELDLSKAGRHSIVAEVVWEADEYKENNTYTHVVNTISVDKYKLDFELCEDFDIDGFVPAWKTVDNDGLVPEAYDYYWNFKNMFNPFAFIALNSEDYIVYTDAPTPSYAHSGKRCGASFFTSGNDDWLISPKLKLGGVSEKDVNIRPRAEFYVSSLAANALEDYRVLVSTTDDKLESFVVVPDFRGNKDRIAPLEYTKVTVDLSAYMGQEIYFAIQCVSKNKYVFLIDDIEVFMGDVNAVEDLELLENISLYPNPVASTLTIMAKGMEIESVEILNACGSKVYNKNNVRSESFKLDAESFSSGLYFAKVKTNRGTKTIKFTIK